MKLFGRKRTQRSVDTSEKSSETVNVQSRDVSVAESDTEMMTENVYLGQEQYQPKELQVSAASLIGSRRNQQDSLCYTSLPDKGFLAVVCDGMGGLGGGELASYTACAGMVDAFEKRGDAQPADFFVRTASEIDVSVAGIADAEGVPIGAGTTLAAVWIKENCVPLTDGVDCGNCARHCPAGAILMVPSDPDMSDSPKIPVINTERCIGCGACENLCPSRPFSAIYVEGHEMHRIV